MFVLPVSDSVLADLLGDDVIEASFSDSAMLARMLAFEAALIRARERTGIVTSEAADAIFTALEDFTPDPARLRNGTCRDGVAVPELVCAVRARLEADHRSAFHAGATSQDLIDTALASALSEVNSEFDRRMTAFDAALERLASEQGHRTVMGRTRMQDAQLISFGDRTARWRREFVQHARQLKAVSEDVEILQFGGPLGDRSAFGEQAAEIAALMAKDLGLRDPGEAWHSQRGGLTRYASWMATLSGILGKFGQDCALMAQMGELRFAGGGQSSAMPHKSNPVAAETLVTLARFNAALTGGMQQAVIHEQERSGSAWTLEWLLLPQMCVAAGASLRTGLRLLDSIRAVGRD